MGRKKKESRLICHEVKADFKQIDENKKQISC